MVQRSVVTWERFSAFCCPFPHDSPDHAGVLSGRWWVGWRRCAFRALEPSAPDGEDEEHVKALGMVAAVPRVAGPLARGVVLAEHPVNEIHVDLDAGVGEAREWVGGEQVVVEALAEGAEVGAEPLANGDGEALLGAVDDVVGEVVAGDLLEEALAFAFGHEDIERGAEGGVDEVASEEGGADLEGDGHRGGVGFEEEVVGEVVQEVVAERVIDLVKLVIARAFAIDLGDEPAEVGSREDGEEFAVSPVAGGDGEAGRKKVKTRRRTARVTRRGRRWSRSSQR